MTEIYVDGRLFEFNEGELSIHGVMVLENAPTT